MDEVPLDLGAAQSQAETACREACPALVAEKRAEDDSSPAWVIFPAASSAIGPQLLRNVACNALLRGFDGRVWQLRAVGHPWSEAWLHVAADLLVATHERRWHDPMLEHRLARALELPKVEVRHPVLDRVEPAHWDLRKLAIGLCMQQLGRHVPSPEPRQLAAEVEAIARSLESSLGDAIGRFVDGLDAEVIGVAPRSLADTRLYNFLVPAAQRRNRLQFAETFPVLMRAAASEDQSGIGADVRRVVDAGLPLLKALSRRWGVAPAVLRCLRHRPPGVVGARWESNIEALFALLDALPAEFRPRQDPAQWRDLNGRVAAAESIFGPHPWNSPLALAWLRHGARRLGDASMAQAATALEPAAVAEIDALRRALIEVLTREAQEADDDEASLDASAIRARSTADRYLCGLAPRRMSEQAARFRQSLAWAQSAAVARSDRPAADAAFWRLLPHEYRSRDGSRRVASLATPHALRQHGRALNNCLADSHLAHYASASRRGESFIVGVFDGDSGSPLSTAELRIKAVDLGLRLVVEVLQHTAASNSPPSGRCRTALAETVTWLSSGECRPHVTEGLRQAGQRRRGERQRLPTVQALRVAIGEARFESLCAAARGVAATTAR